jgi:hypothetical protein
VRSTKGEAFQCYGRAAYRSGEALESVKLGCSFILAGKIRSAEDATHVCRLAQLYKQTDEVHECHSRCSEEVMLLRSFP